jgi:uncharacterized protein (DUF58 family)
MAFDTDRPVTPKEVDEQILGRGPWYVVGIILIVASLVIHQPLLVVAGLLILALGGVPELWYRFCLRGLSVRRSLSAGRAQIGDGLILTITIENRKLLPLPRLEVVDEVPEYGLAIRGGYLENTTMPLRMHLVHLLSPWALQRVTRRYHVSCLARGSYFFGPIHLESGDPFGLLTREEVLDLTAFLLVYPLVVPLDQINFPAGVPMGERTTLRRILEDPLRTAGVRDYMQGDEPRRIHWKATAHTGTLQSKIFEATTQHTLALFVDTRTFERASLGYDPDLFELALCTAASVATWGSQQGYAIGLYSNGLQVAIPEDFAFLGEQPGGNVPSETTEEPSSEPTSGNSATQFQRRLAPAIIHPRLSPSAASGQLPQILEALARIIPYYAGTMTDLLLGEERTLPFGSTVVYICSARVLARGESDEIALLRRMHKRGYRVAVLVTGDATTIPFEALRGLPMVHVGNGQAWQDLYRSALNLHGLDSKQAWNKGIITGLSDITGQSKGPEAPQGNALGELPWEVLS